MKLLIDTHVFLWFVLDDVALSTMARELIINPQNDILLSPASYWELAIKISLGKYQIPGLFEPWMNYQLQSNEFVILPIEVAHAATVIKLPFHHKDPFDRLLISQSIVEKIAIVSADIVFDSYGVTRLW
jgi:PIN domain nuclease of toxin-antitoxin system